MTNFRVDTDNGNEWPKVTSGRHPFGRFGQQLIGRFQPLPCLFSALALGCYSTILFVTFRQIPMLAVQFIEIKNYKNKG